MPLNFINCSRINVWTRSWCLENSETGFLLFFLLFFYEFFLHPFIIGYILLFPLILCFRLILRISDDEGVERNHRLGQMQQLLHSLVSFFQGIEGCPYTAKSQAVSHQQDVLRGCRTVLNPELPALCLPASCPGIRKPRWRAVPVSHAGIRAELWYLVENLPGRW